MDDKELLREYARERSQEAFEELVGRHLGMVYATALRETGSAEAAEDVSQAVFLVLSQKARRLTGVERLAGWLFRATRFAGVNARQLEKRRARHERRAAEMRPEMSEQQIEETWERIEPELNAALGRLGSREREAIILRYLEERSVKEVAEAMGVSEAAAKMRIGRGLEKLRGLLGGKEGMVSVGGLGAVLEAKAIVAVPAGLAGAVTAAVVGGAVGATTTASVIAEGAMKMMMWAKIKIVAAVAVAVLMAVGLSVAVAQVAGSGRAPVTVGSTQLAAAPPSTLPAATQPAVETPLAALLRPVIEAQRANLSRINTWSGGAEITYGRSDADGILWNMRSTASFVYDSGRGAKRWKWIVQEAQHRVDGVLQPDPVQKPGASGAHDVMIRPDGYFRCVPGFLPAGSDQWQRTLVILPAQAAEGQSIPRSFDPFWYFSLGPLPYTDLLEGWIEVEPKVQELKTGTMTAEREGTMVTLKISQGENLKMRYQFDLSKAGHLVEIESQPGAAKKLQRLSYSKIGDTWVPAGLSMESKSGEISESETVKFTENRVNERIADDEFTLEAMGVEAGMRVSDHTRRVFYFYGDEGNAKPIKPRMAPGAAQPAKEVGP